MTDEKVEAIKIRITMEPDPDADLYRPKIEHNTDPMNLALSLVAAVNVAVPQVVEMMRGLQDQLATLQDPERIVTPDQFRKEGGKLN